MSYLKVLVQWKNPTVQGGDDIECNVTFKNICSSIDSPQSATRLPSPASRRDSCAEPLPPPVERKVTRKLASHTVVNFRPRNVSHRSTYSFDTPLSIRQASGHRVQRSFAKSVQEKDQRSHKRSISIVSIGDESLLDKIPTSYLPVASKRPIRAHGRALSFQALPRAVSRNLKPISGKQTQPFYAPEPILTYTCQDLSVLTSKELPIHPTMVSFLLLSPFVVHH